MRRKSFFEKITGAINTNEFDGEDVQEEESRNESPQHDRENSREPNQINRGDRKPEVIEENEEEAQLSADVYQTPENIIIQVMAAGVDPDSLDIQISRDVVTIKGDRGDSRSVPEEDFFYKELYWGSFSRTILLPAEIEVEEAEALENHGMITLRLPKIDKDRKTKLKVKSK